MDASKEGYHFFCLGRDSGAGLVRWNDGIETIGVTTQPTASERHGTCLETLEQFVLNSSPLSNGIHDVLIPGMIRGSLFTHHAKIVLGDDSRQFDKSRPTTLFLSIREILPAGEKHMEPDEAFSHKGL